jgi:hypothetical protein
MHSLSTKVEYATDITLGRLKSYRVQPQKRCKQFLVFIRIMFLGLCVFKVFLGYSCFDLLEFPEASHSGWN